MALDQLSASSIGDVKLPTLYKTISDVDNRKNNKNGGSKLLNNNTTINGSPNLLISGENYWFLDIKNSLLDVDKFTNISFNGSISYPERVNNVVRVCIILGILLALVMRDYNWLWFPILVAICTYVLYLFRVNAVNNAIKDIGPDANITKLAEPIKTHFEKFIDMNRCVKPTVDNPFMNALVFDPRDRPEACDIDTPERAREVEKLFNTGLYRSASDIFNKNNSQREFYVMPCTTFPNDQTGFAQWLYGTPPTCKEGNGAQCIANIMDNYGRRLETPGYQASA